MVYFIKQGSKFIKIGYSTNINRRLNELQTASPLQLKILAIIPGNNKTELGIHELLKGSKYSGEWFKNTQELKYFIRAIRDNPNVFNIKELYLISLKLRILDKAKRRGNAHKLTKRLKTNNYS